MSYPGSKNGAGVYQTLINLIPPHRIFISAFAGQCAVGRRMRRAEQLIFIDTNAQPLTVLRNEITNVSTYVTCGIAWLRHYFDLDRLDPAPPPARSSAAEYNVAVPPGVGVFCFLDPPYLHDTRHPTKLDLYGEHEMDLAQHTSLLQTILRLPCCCMITHYPCDLYNVTLAGWNHRDYINSTRGGPKTERVWFNYKPPQRLHDSRFLGDDRRERERIARRKRNWRNQLEDVDPLERQAILDELLRINGR